MPSNDVLTPTEASYIATNAYFTLRDWAIGAPKAGAPEQRSVVKDRVLGAGQSVSNLPNPTLGNTALKSAQLGQVYSARSGFGTESGFGYTLSFDHGGRSHAVVAVRGTRPEMAGKPDLITDLRASLTSFGDYGPVHKGFKASYDSAMASLAGSSGLIRRAQVVHVVGHSLGGAIATLIAGQLATEGKVVRLYTFGSPRVGAFSTYAALQRGIGQDNIYRVAHDLDPISLLGPFPFIHVNPGARDRNNMTIPSPTGTLFGFANHDMNRYIRSVTGGDDDWGVVRLAAMQVDHDEAVLARWLLNPNNDPGWIEVASAKTLSILFRLFRHVLRTQSTSIVLGLTALDLIAELIQSGLCRMKVLGEEIYQLLRFASQWAGLNIQAGADFTVAVLRAILERMLSTLRALAIDALRNPTRFLRPMPIVLAGGIALAAVNAF